MGICQSSMFDFSLRVCCCCFFCRKGTKNKKINIQCVTICIHIYETHPYNLLLRGICVEICFRLLTNLQMVSFMEMLLILKNFRGNAIKLWRKIKSFRYQPWEPSDNANYGKLQRWLSAVSLVLHRISLQAISCRANFHSCPLAAVPLLSLLLPFASLAPRFFCPCCAG